MRAGRPAAARRLADRAPALLIGAGTSLRRAGPSMATERFCPRASDSSGYSAGVGAPPRHKRSRSGRLLDAAVWGVPLGAAGGAVLGAAVDSVGGCPRRSLRRRDLR